MEAQPKRKPRDRSVYAGALYLLGLPGYVHCTFSHLCVAGHMKHPPFGFLDWIVEGLWMSAFLGAFLLGFQSGRKWSRVLGYCSLFLLVSRLLMYNIFFLMILIDGPIAFYLLVFTLIGLAEAWNENKTPRPLP
jgi:hypothetical protein